MCKRSVSPVGQLCNSFRTPQNLDGYQSAFRLTMLDPPNCFLPVDMPRTNVSIHQGLAPVVNTKHHLGINQIYDLNVKVRSIWV